MSKVYLQLMLSDFKLYIYSYLNVAVLFSYSFSPERIAISTCILGISGICVIFCEVFVDLIIKHFNLKCKHNCFIQMPVFEQYIVFDVVQYSYINMCIPLLSKRGKNSVDFFYEFCWYFCLSISVISFVLFNCLRFFSFTEWNFYKYIFFFRNLFYAE